MEERRIRKLMATMKCSACGQNYESPDIEILGHRAELWFMRVHCAGCKTRVLIAAVVKESKAPTMSDLSKSEYLRFKTLGAVADDELLDMHSFLKDFDGDFQKIFGGQ
jgi:DNA-directed RNA polymerase subunit RPC12/RpoP